MLVMSSLKKLLNNLSGQEFLAFFIINLKGVRIMPNPNHDPKDGRFTTKDGRDASLERGFENIIPNTETNNYKNNRDASILSGFKNILPDQQKIELFQEIMPRVKKLIESANNIRSKLPKNIKDSIFLLTQHIMSIRVIYRPFRKKWMKQVMLYKKEWGMIRTIMPRIINGIILQT